MNPDSAPGDGEGSNTQDPFLLPQPPAEQVIQDQYYLEPVYDPYGLSHIAGNPFDSLCSVPVPDYMRYFVPPHPIHMGVNRPFFESHIPLLYPSTPIWHYSPWKQVENKETQTDPKKPEGKRKKKQDHSMENQSCDPGNTAYIPTSIAKRAETPMEKQDGSGFMENFGMNSSRARQFRSKPPPGFAYEKEEVRIGYNNDFAPAIQLSKIYKETVPLYNVTEKPVPANVMPSDVFALASCEGIVYGPLETIQEEESQHNGRLDAAMPGTSSNWPSSPLDLSKAAQMAEPTEFDLVEERQHTLTSDSSFWSESLSDTETPEQISEPTIQESEPLLSGRVETSNADSPKNVQENIEISLDSLAALEESLWSSDAEINVPPETWMAFLDYMDNNYNMYVSKRQTTSAQNPTSEEIFSLDDNSSRGNVPRSYVTPLQKAVGPLQRSTEGSEKEEIKHGSFIKEDKKAVGGKEQVCTTESQIETSCFRIKVRELSSQCGKMDVLPPFSSRTKFRSLENESAKSFLPSEIDVSGECSVKEPKDKEKEEWKEYHLFQGAAPLAPARFGLFPQVSQQPFQEMPQNVPAQSDIWPVQEKIIDFRPANKPKDPENNERCGNSSIFLKRPADQQHEVPDLRRNLQRYPVMQLNEGEGFVPDEYWLKTGAKPKSHGLPSGVFPPKAESGEPECTPKKKKMHNSPQKHRDRRDDAKTQEQREKAETTHNKGFGRGNKRSLS